MGNSQDAREPFEPNSDAAYDSFDSITGSYDKTCDESIQRKLGVYGSVDSGSGIVGNERGNAYIATDSSSTLLVAYIDTGSRVTVALT